MSNRRSQIFEKIRSRVRFEVPSDPAFFRTHGYCYVWTGPTSGAGRGGGYPRMNLNGATVAVHKAAWTNEYGIVPPRKQLDHLCRNRRCVNVDHLELVTHKRNQKRRSQARSAKPSYDIIEDALAEALADAH